MGNAPHRNVVTARESGFGSYINVGHPIPGACTTMMIRMGADPAATGEQPHAFGRVIALTGDPAAGNRALPIAMAAKCSVHKLLEGGQGSSCVRPREVTRGAGAVLRPASF